MEDQQHPEETDAVLLVKGLHFPVKIAKRILEESSEVLVCSPLLCHITRLSCSENELLEVTVSFLGKSSK